MNLNSVIASGTARNLPLMKNLCISAMGRQKHVEGNSYGAGIEDDSR